MGKWEPNDQFRRKDGHEGSLSINGMHFGARDGTPPHVHSREDELFYVLDGEFDVYVGEAFKVKTGECVFLPKFEPHAFVIRSTQLRALALFSPAGLEEAFRGMSSPAKRLALPTKTLTYSTGDVKTIAKRLNDYRCSDPKSGRGCRANALVF